MGAYRYCDCDRNDPAPMSPPTLVEALTCEYRCPSCGANHWREDDRAYAVEGLVERLEALEARLIFPSAAGLTTADAIVKMDEDAHGLEDPGDWLPISSAPKAGEQIELGGPSGYIAPNDWHVETGRWGPHAFPHGCWIDDTGCPITDCFPEPTHWRPCRPQPKGA